MTTDITYAQVDSWFGHCRRDLKLDLIYPEDGEGKTYPCIVWICGGAWQRMSSESLLMGFNAMTHPQEAYENSPVSKVTPDAPPFLLIHGTKDRV